MERFGEIDTVMGRRDFKSLIAAINIVKKVNKTVNCGEGFYVPNLLRSMWLTMSSYSQSDKGFTN